MSPSTACLWSLGVCGQSGLRSWLCTCQGQEPVLKKEPRRNQRARPAGALHRQAQPGPGRPPAPSRPSSAGLQDLGHPVRMWVPPCPSPHTSHPPPHSGGVVWRGGGFKSPRVSDRSDRSPNSSQAQVPLHGSERLSGIALPWIRRRFMDFHSAWSLSIAQIFRLPPQPPRLGSQVQESAPVASLRTQLLALQPSPLVLSPQLPPPPPQVRAGPMNSKERSEGDGNCVLRPLRIAASSGDLVL